MYNEVISQRGDVVKNYFPEGIPDLWCPIIVQYKSNKEIDMLRMEQHLSSIVSHVKTFLLFGSTGDGWELTHEEKESLLQACIDWSHRYGIKMLLGVLQPGLGESKKEIQQWVEWLMNYTHKPDVTEALKSSGVVGFTICPPKGSDLSQDIIGSELETILRLNLPTAIYQLPQVTQNEIEPDTLHVLAKSYPNFYLFKDTSGSDNVLKSGLDFYHVFFVRGMEGDYCDWFSLNKRRYNGFLLSSANCLANLLSQMLKAAKAGEIETARKLSFTVQQVIEAVFSNTSSLDGGNVFANSNKCIDHCLAYGRDWEKYPLPMRHCGQTIPRRYAAFAAETLDKYGLLPEKGYMFQ